MVERSAVLDDAYGALAHPLRRAILERLRGGDATVTELAEPFEVSLAAVSKHIRVLEDAGLIRRTVTGREHRLTMDPRPLEDAAGWLGAYRVFWEQRLDALDARLRSRRGG